MKIFYLKKFYGGKKEAFSDGVSTKENSWFTILQNHINQEVSDIEFQTESEKIVHCKPMTKEAYYYRKIFNQKFGDKYSNVIPHFWLPKWCGDIIEPSARVLDVYDSNNHVEVTN